MALLFLHGAGGHDEDQVLVRALREGLAEPVLAPRLPDEDMSHDAWAACVRDAITPQVRTVVGHSFGGSTVLRMATQADLGVDHLVLLAAPDWGPKGWDVADYALPDDAAERLDPALRVTLHHCADDEVVPAGHLDLLSARLPAARRVLHDRGGHQLMGDATTVVVGSLSLAP
ncbi:alpha/beta fold hydrolase [Janibacter sp. UYMM211]|uniref:alpha/beta fold hydrolase n=1 Tax=Janibacter sp. UYMM211 TaxID=3156342 RepID=UPI0033936F68